jgi:hypothetical protein
MTVKAQFGPSYSRSLTVEFTWADVPGQLLIGKVPAGFFCPSCVVEIIDPFDGGTQITVGDLVAQGRFQGAADNDPETSHLYETEPHFAYPTATNVYVFFSGSPSVGRGRVILYLG